ncbi:MAG: tRNA pseudouridine55 synthase [Actinomycetota bacterium]|nr:tRNA pseudouridine55 synthase [Actinomycetota bacterium]
MTVDGVLVIDKPAGMTSHDVVERLRRVFATKKVGHAGTLDPDATGVLVLGFGRATRFLMYSQAAPKRYTAVAQLGVTTSTQDASGAILSTSSAADLDRAAVMRAVRAFVGEIEQIPPMVSAVKVGGERLYQKARRGEEIDRPPRRVTIYELEVTSFEPGPQARATLSVKCSAGTYVRTLAHDLGQQLGCGAHLNSLCRTEAGGFMLSDAEALERVELGMLRPLEDVVRPLGRVDLDDAEARAVGDGKPIPAHLAVPDGALRALFANGRLMAVYRRAGDLLRAETVVGDLATRR